jgi:ribosomal protein S5
LSGESRNAIDRGASYAKRTALAIDGMRLTATVGFDGDSRPAEVFLDGAKDGSGLATVLEDAIS